VSCPNCQTKIPLTETLARPLLEAERARLAADVEKEVQQRIDREREQIRRETVETEQKRNKLMLDAKDQEVTDLTAKLGQAQKNELEVRRQRQALEQEKNAIELEVARQLDEERKRIRESTQKEEADRHQLQLDEKEKLIKDMKGQIEELQRKSQQGSQQLQGEVQELALEGRLREAFPKDEIEAVPVGRNGGDVVQKVIGQSGLVCGVIVWESKRTKTWSDAWLAKNREDQRAARAHVGVIVSAALPRGVDAFNHLGGVWVTSFSCAIPLAIALRQGLIEAASSQLANQDREGKTDRLFAYVTGPEFKQRVSAIVEGVASLSSELDRNMRSNEASYARQQKSIELTVRSAAGLCGAFQGILGKCMPEIQGLEPPQLEAMPPALELGDQ
jgi:hypothetical protein